MKRYAVTFFIAALALALVPALSGCGSDNTSSDNSTPDITSTTPQSTDSEPSSQQTTVSDIISLPESSDNSSTINDLRTQIVSTAEALVGVDYVSGMQRLSRASIIRDLYTMSFVKTALSIVREEQPHRKKWVRP